MRRLTAIISGLLFSLTLSSQDFNYTVATDSVTWNELSSQVILNTNNSAWEFAYRIPIGFTFHFAGRNCDSLTIETNGFLLFDEDRYYAFTMFHDFEDRISGGQHSVLGYEISGTPGSRILKIQYKNTGRSGYSGSHTFQVWLKEDGNQIEVRVGPTTYYYLSFWETVVDPVTQEFYEHLVYVPDTNQYVRIGLINQIMDTDTVGYFVGGTLAAPQGHICEHSYPEPVFFHLMPFEGTRFVFTPSQN
jgi:hypothetical protein